MFDDIKDAELSLKSSVFIEEVVEDFRHWMTDLERIKKDLSDKYKEAVADGYDMKPEVDEQYDRELK